MPTPVEMVLDRLEEKGCSPRREGAGWSALCPAHDDRKPSLSVGAGDKERALLRCQTGCDFSDVVAALGLEPRELFSSVNASTKTIVATYSYVDEQDGPLFEAVRYWPKDFRQRRPDGAGGWTWKLGDVRRVLYRLPSVLEAAARGDTVYVVEGEKDVHALERLGHVATCNPMGAGKWRSEYSESLRGADVVVVADRDEPGRAHARAVAGSLHDAAKSVAVVEPTRGDDVAEHLGAGGTLDELVAPTAEPEPKPEPANGDTFPLLTIADLAALPKPSWLLDTLLPVGGLSVLYGPSGVGKSFLALDWALCVAHGLEWFGHTARGGVVVYVVAEGVSGLFPRIEAWSTERRQPVADRIRFIPLAVNMLDRGDVERAQRTLALLSSPPTLLVVDTLARSMVGGDENSARDVGLLIAGVDRLRGEHGAAGLVVHHTGRNGEDERGSTALRGAADMMHALKTDGAGLRLRCEKSKDSEPYEPLSMHLAEVAESVVPRSKVPVERLAPAELEILAGVPESFGTALASASAIRDATGVAKTSIHRALKSLVERGLMAEDATERFPRYRVTEAGLKRGGGAFHSVPERSIGTPNQRSTPPPPLGGGTVEQGTGTAELGSKENHLDVATSSVRSSRPPVAVRPPPRVGTVYTAARLPGVRLRVLEVGDEQVVARVESQTADAGQRLSFPLAEFGVELRRAS